MKFETTLQNLKDIEADCEIIIAVAKNLNHKWIKDQDDLKNLDFKGESEEVIHLSHTQRVYVGSDSFCSDDIRLATATAIKSIKKAKYKSVKIGIYSGENPAQNIKAMAEGIMLGSYSFDRYKTEKQKSSITKVIISSEDYSDTKLSLETIKEALNVATIVAESTNLAKDIANTAPYDMTPKKLANFALKLNKKLNNTECLIGNKKFLKKEKMRAFLAVARASANPPRFIHLTYKPKVAKKKFVFVGKGLTYDSGGLSLKPSDYMVTMKSDKSGAAAALGIINGASKLNLPFEIHVIIGAAENMIGGNAYKPDDILKSRSGKTIEVRNTDAEGRLVLADCLSFAQDLKPDYLIDLATLTGACVVALGEYTTGVMGHSSSLKHNFCKEAKKSGELVSTLPFNRYLKKLLKSSVADISNISSSRYGGAITAALFLDNFIEDEYKEKWLHLDIAGPAYVEKEWGYNQAGASGAGVRMCLYWLSSLAKS
jgi:leucyl aminopeptidase